jgi:TM2 domain-containing membrane protein YozV
MFEAWRVRQADVDAREEALRERLRALSDDQRRRFYQTYRPRLRDPDTYAVLNWFFVTGLHHFYLGRIGAGLLNLLLMLSGIVLLFGAPLIGLGLILLVLVAELPALFRSQTVVADHNVRVGEETLAELGMS